MNGDRTNWRSTLGGACGAAGAAITGGTLVAGVLDILPKQFLVGFLITGVILNVLGIFFGHLFAADAKALSSLKEQVKENTEAVSVLKGNTPAPTIKP